MTKEEAAEEILQGRAWKPCMAPGCKEGYVYHEDFRGVPSACFNCDGYGTVLRQRYAKACRMLHRPQPERAHIRAYELPAHSGSVSQKSIDAFSKAIDEEILQLMESGDE